MNCPNCGNEYVCPCKSCREREKEKTPWTQVGESSESRPKCGLTKTMDEWFDIEGEQYFEKKAKGEL